MIVKCIKGIKKHNILFKKGEYCDAEKINDMIISICDLDFNRGFTVRIEDFSNNFEIIKIN